jgi:cyclic-di-GMP phosphodiesterase, flagellum assembly factor TipF
MTKQDNPKPQAGAVPSEAPAQTVALGPAPANGPASPVAAHDGEPAREPKSRDGLIVGSIAIASFAVAVMCFAQFGLSLPISGVMGIAALALLMLVHKQAQKTAQITQLKAELARTRQAAKPRTMPRAAPLPPSGSAEARIRELSRDIGNLVPLQDASSGSAAGSQPTLGGAIAADIASERANRKPKRVFQPVAPESLAKPEAELGSGPFVAGPASEASGASPQVASSEPIREQWSFRPRTDAQVAAHDASSPLTSTNGGGGQTLKMPVTTTIEGDLELVQRKIKELADEVNAAEALRPKTARVVPRQAPAPSALEDSIGALKAAAKSMRTRPSLGDFIPKFGAQAQAPAMADKPEPPKEGFGELVIPATAERIAGSDPASSAPQAEDRDFAPPSLELPLPEFVVPSEPGLSPQLAAIARAVDDDAVDVLLGPIVTLAEHAVGHYEMAARLHSLTGEPLHAAEDDFAQIGSEREASFDIARLNRAAALAARMEARDREGSLLVEFLGSSMTNRAFLEAFAQAYEARPRISAQLVLTFSQRAVDGFQPSAWQAVQDMHSFGFRLALDHVQHIATDFAALQKSGFRFVRMDAGVLLNGMMTPDRVVPAEEIIQRTALAGISIIACGVQNAETQKRLLDAGILLGQGPLFGAPRNVNVDGGAMGPAGQSAAA